MASFNHQTSALRICIDSEQDGKLGGRVYSQMLTAPLEFSDTSHLLLQIDRLLDAQNYPKAFQRARAFRAGETPFTLAASAPGAGLTVQDVAAAKGAVATVGILIISRRSSTWQGKIDWEDGTPAIPFSSALEVMHQLSLRCSSLSTTF